MLCPHLHDSHHAIGKAVVDKPSHRPLEALSRVVGTGSPFPGTSPRFKRVDVSPGTRGALFMALAKAGENSRLVLAPGLYIEDEQIVIPAGVSITCDQAFDEENLQDGTKEVCRNEARVSTSCEKLGNVPFICIRDHGCSISNIVFQVTGGEGRDHRQFPCLDISGTSDANVSNCAFLCANRSAVRVKGTAAPSIESCTLICSKEGILIQGHAAPIVKNNNVTVEELAIRAGHGTAGKCSRNVLKAGRDACIVGEGMSRTVFVENKLTIDAASQFGCAVVVRNSSCITLERNTITGSHYNGMQVGDCSNPVVKDNSIVGSRASGIVIHEYATGVFVRNRIERSKLAGIGIRDSAEPYLKGNVVRDGAASGVVVMGDAKCIFEENKIRDNQGSGVRVTAASSEVLFDGNEVSGNRACGFWLDGDCRCTVQNNQVRGSERAGIYVTQRAAPRVSHNVVSDGETAGILLDDHAAGDFDNNVVSKNAACNVMLGGSSRGVFEHNLVARSPSGGVLCFGECSCELRRNRIEDNAVANVAVLDNAQPTLKGNVVKNGSGRGLVVGGCSEGVFAENSVMGNGREGLYIGGEATPTLERNAVSDNGGSGMVIEDRAQGVFVDNVFRDNDGPAVAVQGDAKPDMQRSVVRHSGKGGIWLLDRAGGTVKDTDMDDEHAAESWKRGLFVSTQVLSSLDSRSGIGPAVETRLPSIGRVGNRAQRIAVISNPGREGKHAIAKCDSPTRTDSTASPRPVSLPELKLPRSPAFAH